MTTATKQVLLQQLAKLDSELRNTITNLECYQRSVDIFTTRVANLNLLRRNIEEDLNS